jgi:hypothetical protein
MVFGIPGDGHLPAIRHHGIPLRYACLGVICSLGVDVRLNLPQDAVDCRCVKEEHVVDAVESSEDFRALSFGLQRAPFSLERGDAGVAVDAEYQHVAECPGFMQISYVADMKKIETAVGKNDPFPAARVATNVFDFGKRLNLL